MQLHQRVLSAGNMSRVYRVHLQEQLHPPPCWWWGRGRGGGGELTLKDQGGGTSFVRAAIRGVRSLPLSYQACWVTCQVCIYSICVKKYSKIYSCYFEKMSWLSCLINFFLQVFRFLIIFASCSIYYSKFNVKTKFAFHLTFACNFRLEKVF